MLKGVSVKYMEPDIYLPVTHDILHQICQALPCIISDWYLVVLYHSMLISAFNGMLRLGEFAYSPNVVRKKNIIFDGQGVILYTSRLQKHINSPFANMSELSHSHSTAQFTTSGNTLKLGQSLLGHCMLNKTIFKFNTQQFWHYSMIWHSF